MPTDPAEIEENVEAFGGILSQVPEQQPPFFDENGNLLLPIGAEAEQTDDGESPFRQWATYAYFAEDFLPSLMLEALTYRPLSDGEEAGYDAPFPTRDHMAGPRSFPNLLNELAGRSDARRDALTNYQGPFLTIFGGNDPGLTGDADDQQWMIDNIPGAEGQEHIRMPDASHYLQDDQGEEIAQRVHNFILANPPCT